MTFVWHEINPRNVAHYNRVLNQHQGTAAGAVNFVVQLL